VRAARLGLALALLAHPALAQEWRGTARVGQVTQEGTPAGASGNSSLVLGLSRGVPRGWLGASVALPVGEDPFWVSLGGWKRLETRGAAGVLLDLSANGFLQRQDATVVPGQPAPGPLPLPTVQPQPTRIDRSGQGLGGELMAGGFLSGPRLRAEARGGIAAQRSEYGDVTQRRALPTGDARISLLLSALTVSAESRVWLDDAVTRTYAGGAIRWASGPVQLWGSLGGWVAGGLDRPAWSAGGAVEIAPAVEIQAGGRGNALDPLYLTSTESSVWAGLAFRLGGARTSAAPVARRDRDGHQVIRLPARESKGIPSIAGDFNGWKPEPMGRDGSRWVWRGRLAPGVYHYAFVDAGGTWFVPEAVPGRRDDGMGGQVAVLVVE
jgi:hypothetical protein